MKNILIMAILVLVTSTAAMAQRRPPAFTHYPVRAENIKSKPVNLKSHKDARMFRTNLRNAAKGNVNFAGHFILTSWGCGTNCNQVAIINARNGSVYFPRELQGIGIGQGEWAYDIELLEYKANSRMLKLNGYDGGAQNRDEPSEGIHYYQWTGTALKKIRFDKKERNQ